VTLLVVADSLAFHGPERGELSTRPELFPNVAAADLGTTADLVARRGWTARDAWWALTRDPLVYSVLLPRADAVLLAVGGMDYLPAVVPTYLR
jgi:diglucosylglycerate octanoyltransferase